MRSRITALAVGMLMLLAACNDEGLPASALADLQLVGVDFDLNSIMLTNNGGDDVRTDDLWMYQDGEFFRFNIFTIQPRAAIRFSVRDIGGVDSAGGEIALFASDSFSDPEAMLDYVAWGTSRHSRSEVAIEAQLWSPDQAVVTQSDTLALLRIDPSTFGTIAWEASAEAP